MNAALPAGRFLAAPGALFALLCLLGTLLLALPGSAGAKDAPALSGLHLRVLAEGNPALQAALGGEPRFVWPDEQQLSAELDFTLEGYSGTRSVELFAVLFEERPGQRDSKYAQPLVKLKGKHELPIGAQRLAFPELWHTQEVPGLRRYRLEIEAALKGAKAVKLTQHFVVEGPPLPEVEIISLESWNPADSRESAIWQPGEMVQLNMLFELRGNRARRGPNLVVYAVMDEDRYLMELEDQPETWRETRNWDARALPPEDGVYQCVLRARLPVVFGEPWNNQHPFTIHAVLDYGAGRPAAEKTQGTLVDYHSGEERREPELDFRLIDLDPAQRWDIRRVRAGV